MKPKDIALKVIAERIASHLARFENDPKINAGWRMDKTTGRRVPDPSGVRNYYHAGAHAAGRYVMVTYVSYQGSTALSKEQALKYLAWLDAGNVGTHRDEMRGNGS